MVTPIEAVSDRSRSPKLNGAFSALRICSAVSAILPAACFGREDDGELVAAEARHGIERAHDAGDAAGDGEQHGIGGGMADALLELHEAVDVDEEDRRLDAAGHAGADQGALEPVEEELLVGQAGQAVVHGVVQQAVAAGAVLVDVLQGADDAVDLAVAAQHRLHPHAEGAVVAVVGGEPHVGGDLAAAQFDQGVEGGAEAVAILGVDAVEPALDGAAQRAAALAEAGAEFVGDRDAVALDVPVEDEVARAGQRQRAALDFAQRADATPGLRRRRAAPR